jgi:uncharacterized protein YndB with AHSA1/START domain
MNQDTIEKRIELKAPISRVWRALTNHVEFGQWFRVDLEGPFVVGQLSLGRITYPGYEHMKWEALIETMRTNELFSFKWPHPADPNDPNSAKTWTLVEFRLTPTATGTLLVVRESGFSQLPASQRAEAFRSNEGGWAEQMTNIERHVAQS